MDLKTKRKELTEQAMQVTQDINQGMKFVEQKQEEAVRIDAQIALLDQLIDDENEKSKEGKKEGAEEHGANNN